VVEQYIRKPNTTCSRCGKSIYRRPSELQKTGGVSYCGAICYGIACRKEVECVVCKKKMLAGLNKKTCSRSCSNVNRIGIEYLRNRPRDKVSTIVALKTRLLKMRGGKCERCEYSKIEILHVHHKNRNRLDNSMKNLEPICPNCHYEEHYLNNNDGISK
jgi:hypothetical protein